MADTLTLKNHLRWICLLTTISMLCLRGIATCPQECQCNMQNDSIVCINQSLTSLPFQIPTEVTSLDLENNNFSSLNSLFQNFTKLRVIILSYNKIPFIQEEDFKNQKNLTFLNIGHNNISNIHDNSFQSLINLQELDLTYNVLTSLPNNIFHGLPNFQMLQLAGNRLSNLTWITFQDLEHLVSLDLSFNQISVIDNGLLQHLNSLEKLNLQHNGIVYIGHSAFPASLSWLDLSFNRLKSFDFIMSKENTLKWLDLGWNDISEFTADSFTNCSRLESITLDANPVQSIQSPIFQSLYSLRNLSMCQMNSLIFLNPGVFQGLEHLVMLNMSNNSKLEFIRIDTFIPLKSVERLDISHNNFTKLLSTTFRANTRLTLVDLRGNPFVCDCDIDWLLQNIKTNFSIIEAPELVECILPFNNSSVSLKDLDHKDLHCDDVVINNYTKNALFKIGSTAILHCHATSIPRPMIIWKTPRKRVLTYHNFHPHASRDYLPLLDTDKEHSVFHSSHNWHNDLSYNYFIEARDDRLAVLEDGSLYIDYVLRSDAGPYQCIAENPRNMTSVEINLKLDYTILNEVKIWSIVMGLISAASFFLLNLIYSLTTAAARKCISLRRRERVRQIIENIEQYKNVQISRIKENYHGQVGKIRDQYHYSLGRIREHYTTKAHTMGRLREGASLKVDKLRENYNNQIGKLKGYSSNQLIQIRERYNNQILKIKDYGSLQLGRIHEKYKLKQQHVIKLLETMNLDNCRTVFESECVRTESIILESKLYDEDDVPIHSPIDSTSISDSEYMTASGSEASSHEDLRFTARENVIVSHLPYDPHLPLEGSGSGEASHHVFWTRHSQRIGQNSYPSSYESIPDSVHIHRISGGYTHSAFHDDNSSQNSGQQQCVNDQMTEMCDQLTTTRLSNFIPEGRNWLCQEETTNNNTSIQLFIPSVYCDTGDWETEV
ncbi:hypothetical protein ACJMK2_031287 [Sinanodonta woodiana]|uniref:Ig-like domain-containing protein n=1 Tax=Sinanodonta woodiana TaxID=1069815 RepID=A0ABD3X291_SINWO